MTDVPHAAIRQIKAEMLKEGYACPDERILVCEPCLDIALNSLYRLAFYDGVKSVAPLDTKLIKVKCERKHEGA